MGADQGCAPGHYGALGVPTAASQREIELAFQAWRDGCRKCDAYRRAEVAYHVLSDAGSRASHDRQLGLSFHPAWGAGLDRFVKVSVRRALLEFERGRAVKARTLLSRAASIAPRDPFVRSYLALALARTGGNLHEAVAHGRYALGRRPREAAFYFNLAEVYAAAGLRARARVTGLLGWGAVATSLIRWTPRTVGNRERGAGVARD